MDKHNEEPQPGRSGNEPQPPKKSGRRRRRRRKRTAGKKVLHTQTFVALAVPNRAASSTDTTQGFSVHPSGSSTPEAATSRPPPGVLIYDPKESPSKMLARQPSVTFGGILSEHSELSQPATSQIGEVLVTPISEPDTLQTAAQEGHKTPDRQMSPKAASPEPSSSKHSEQKDKRPESPQNLRERRRSSLVVLAEPFLTLPAAAAKSPDVAQPDTFKKGAPSSSPPSGDLPPRPLSGEGHESNADTLEGEALFTMFSSDAGVGSAVPSDIRSAPRSSLRSSLRSGLTSRPVSPYYTEDTSEELQDTIFISEASFHGLVYTLLHCFSGAAVSILTKRLKFVPKAKIAFYVAFSLMTGSMPGAFGTKIPFGPLHLQPLLMLRAFFGIASTMFKAMALAYLHVADVVVISTLIPIGVSFGSWLFLHEKIHTLQWVSMAMTMVGVAIIMRPTSLFSRSFRLNHLTGLLFALGSVLATIQLMVVVRYMRNLTRLKLGFNGNCARVLLSVIASILSGGFDDLLTGRFLGTLMMMGDINFCALVFIVKALEKESAVVVTTVKVCGDIIISMILEAVFLDSYPDLWGLTGSAVIILSSLLLALDKLVHTYKGRSPYTYWLNRLWLKLTGRHRSHTEL